MNLKKPKFWDFKKPNLIAYILLPFAVLLQYLNNLFKKNKYTGTRIKNIGDKILKKTIKELDNLFNNEFKKT